MRGLHFDCFSGISGDMTLAALIDAGVDAAAIATVLDSFGLPIRLQVEKVTKGGLAATHISIEAPQEHEHRHLPDVEAILATGKLRDAQRTLALRIFRNLAEAEAEVHGISIDRVHFHEVGALDSIADIAGVAVALDLLAPERITCRSVPVGTGMVRCAHGLMPVPAPATAKLLRGVPLAPTSLQGELTTPTGAAILKTVVQEWVEQPTLTIDRIGLGAGTRDYLEQPNVLRVFVGSFSATSQEERDTVWQLETNLDDVPGEIIGYCCERLFAAGALDVFTTPIQMKKSRPGVKLSVLAPPEKCLEMESILFRETGTLGIRKHRVERTKLQRELKTISSPWGPLRVKRGWRQGIEVVAPEFEDCARIAREHGIPLREIYAYVRKTAPGQPGDQGEMK